MSRTAGGLRTPSGGRVDRTQRVQFEFDGQPYEGVAGDTLASALLANGVHLTGRSFKYHRPRGILAAGSEEPNALVTVSRDAARVTPNLRATQVELYDGLIAESQHRWPSLKRDFGRINDLLSAFFPSGFYYKTFMWPRKAWKSLYEPVIRRAAGLGRAPTHADPDRYAQRYAHCDVLVVGAGPAGIAAALAAAGSGARVILCDETAEFGGSLLAETSALIDGQTALAWVQEGIASLAKNNRVTLLARTTAFGYFPHNFIGLNQRLSDHLARPPEGRPRERLWQVRARSVVLATGAIERPLVFPGNDRPGILLAGAAHTYLNRYGVRVGTRAVIVTSGDDAYQAALDLKNAGVEIAAVADLRPEVAGALPDAARRAGIDILPGSTVLGTEGDLRVNAVTVGRVHGGKVQAEQRIHCDAVLMSGGYTPSVHLFSQSRGKLKWNDALKAFVPGVSAERERSAGACRGVYDLADVLADGAAAGAAAAGAAAGGGARRFMVDAFKRSSEAYLGALPQAQAPSNDKSFVDWQHDVTSRDLALATREGFQSIEHVKRYTTTGMATDQGKTSNLNAMAIVAKCLDVSIPQVGLTTFRMPYTPVTFGSMAGISRGDLFDPVRATPTHPWAQARAAVFENVGLWKRARYFPRGGEDMHAAVARECRAVRSACGIFDASTLGKIEVVGPDAAEFMNRLYVNNWSNLSIGRSRYGILLREDGFIYDDGVVARTGPDRFHVTTTTGGAPRVLALMEDYRQTEWPELKVWLTSTTEQWAVIAVQGPESRRVLETLVEGIDISSAWPHMSVARGRICGVPMLLFRVSFTGELGFEINVPADFGLGVWEAVYAAGRAHGITEYGTETMHVLRAEKGYIIVGQDTDGTVTPDDAGLTWAIGKHSLERASMKSADRKQLVGLRTKDPRTVLEEGAQVAAKSGQKPPMELIGHVTSSYASSVLGHSIAMAVIESGRARLGQTLYVPMPDGDLEVEVTSPVFYDPAGARINA